MPIPHDIAQPKVSYLDIHLAIQQQILRLEVPMHHHVTMTVFHPRNDLLEETPCFFLEQPSLFDNVVKELSSLQI